MSQPPPTQSNPGVPPRGPPPPGMQQQNMTPSQQRMMPPQYQQMGMQQQPGQYPTGPGYAPMMPMPMMNPGMPMMNPMGMPPPPPPPMSLAILSTISQVFIKQKVDMMEMITGFDTNNRYDIVTPDGGYLFYCQEMSDAFSRQMWGANRAFNIGIMDWYGRQIIQLVRDGVSCCAPTSLNVMSPPGNNIGTCDPNGPCTTSFTVNAGGENLIIEGPGCCCFECRGTCGGSVDFVLRTGDRGEEIGKISKLWSGYMQETHTTADNFGISFPVNLSLEMKAVLIGAAILIDFQFYEVQPNRDRHGHRRHTF